MGTEDLSGSLPQYPEMILGAISALNSPTGSNKCTISNYIEERYGDLLTQHLEKLKESGQLVFVKNNYMHPNPDAPPKRGRGRPSKLKSEAAMEADEGDLGGGYDEENDHGESSEVVVSVGVPGNITGSPTPRGRGRPPKPKSEAAMAATKASVIGPKRGRGRPPKPKSEAEMAAVALAAAAKASVIGPKRGRGRPPKPKSEAAMALDAAKASVVGPKRGRGRPPKPKSEAEMAAITLAVAAKASVIGPKRGRGRPPKPKSEAAMALDAAKAFVVGPKRGRGRPPKPKSEAAMALAAAKASVFGPKRGRGRPPKNRDESDGAATEKRKFSEPSRPRGRPKKIRVVEGECDHNASSGVVPVGVPGGAGPKVKFAIGTTVGF